MNNKNNLNAQTYILTINELGEKVCTSQNDPNKKYILDDDGNMRELNLSSEKNSTENTIDNNESESIEEDRSELDMISDETTNFEENLINELDSDIMNMVDPTCNKFIMQHMDIREPLSKLRKLLENKLHVNLNHFNFYLQDSQILEDHKNLVDQCVQGEGLVQVNVQVQLISKKLNIIDVLKPAKDYVHREELEDEDSDDPSQRIIIEEPKNIVQWQVDSLYKKEQERLKIPLDPQEWSTLHVRHWIQWAVRQFNLSSIKLSDWNINGEELYKLTINDFQTIVPNDPNDVFWTHLELLRKMKLVTVRREESSVNLAAAPNEKEFNNKITNKSYKMRVSPHYNALLKNYSCPFGKVGATKQTGNNGQIQLWQFLLELLTNKEYKSIIQWTGKDAEFKFTQPEVVAALWGERKNKPLMNYEKLSRALRYYYDGDMISKVQGLRFVYKFVCDLKQLLGYSARELSNLIKHGNPMIEEEEDV